MRRFAWSLVVASAAILPATAATPENGGPYNASFLAGGIGIERNLKDAAALVREGASYTISAWVRPDAVQDGSVVLVSLGGNGGACRCLALHGGRLAFTDGATITTAGEIAVDRWTHVAAVSDGSELRLYIDGRLATRASARSAAVTAKIGIAPVIDGQLHFGGSLVGATVDDAALSAAAVRDAAKNPPRFELVQMWKVGVGWEWQNRANTGYWRQQDPWTLPQAKGKGASPVAKPVPAGPALAPLGPDRWQ